MKRILFVCTSNYCRSPMAEGIMDSLLKATKKWYKIEVDSAGTHGGFIGSAPDKHAQQEMQSHGMDIHHQRSRQVTISDFEYFDIIAVMTHSQLVHLKFIAPSQYADKVQRLMSYADVPGILEVPDPYGKPEGFSEVYMLLENACQGLLKALSRDQG